VVLPQFSHFAAAQSGPEKSNCSLRQGFVSRRRSTYICASTGG
jgi:hypothetical protein